ncbi:potassium-transporting ATPase subunit KdpA [Enterococcus sp. BWM-S5]|uniref:Potassium-transporting ATPase potassium-binding subunit n=1 Tax=Enterococcus larvae TaxID=2794352 RepID=A0ABS4CIL5_9ENTE|nr:potassium-transporting ATPase subunit KdpA [Enterococcus larvae]MBP1046107.1 potassium-transporting ATPase subunit KdpA [Enterococcus larvae]
MNSTMISGGVFLLVLLLLAIPLGKYISEILQGRIPRFVRFLEPVEKFVYKVIGRPATGEMSAKKYLLSILFLSFFSLIGLFILLLTQQWLPLNGQEVSGMSVTLALNTAVSFVTNTNWQAYAGEESLSLFSQIFGLTVQNFLSAAVGMAVLCVLIRGFVQKKKNGLGNFWQDITRSILYILLPLSFFISILLVSQGAVQTFSSGVAYEGLSSQSLWLPLGTVASQVAIKQLGTNGGGFFGANSAHPFENPTVISNFIETISILLIPAALIFALGFWIKNWKQGRTVAVVSFLFLIIGFLIIAVNEFAGPEFLHVLATGNMEGKEVRFGIDWSALWAVSTTAASNGSVNSMLDSFTPLGGLIPLFLMQLGEIIFGGAGSGLYGMLTFILLTVFIAGLLVGRTPEYLGKKIEPFEMKMASIVVLTPLLLTLLGAAVLVLHPDILSWLTNQGPHAFSEVLYGATSLANNNGSSFGGLLANTDFLNILGSVLMLISRFLPMAAIIYMAASLSRKQQSAVSEGTLSTVNPVFVTMLIIVILVVGALSFLPAVALGPIADFFQNR